MASKPSTTLIKSLVIAGCLLSPPIALSAQIIATKKNSNISVTTASIDRFFLTTSSNKVGKLEFIGGLEITSKTKTFGGFSGLRLLNSGTNLISLSDTASWFTAKLNRDENNKLTGIANATLSCLCRNNGKPYGSKRWGDSEGLEIIGDKAYVSFERLNRINVYHLDGNQMPSNARQATPSFKPLNISDNKGLEALAIAPKASPIAGKIITIAEESLNKAGDHRAFIANKTTIEEFSIAATNGYQITDADFLENGDLIILERKLASIIDLGVRIRRFKANAIAPSKRVVGEILMESGITSQIDNMEGLATWKNTKGETILTLISDDNFVSLQRTILIEFKLPN